MLRCLGNRSPAPGGRLVCEVEHLSLLELVTSWIYNNNMDRTMTSAHVVLKGVKISQFEIFLNIWLRRLHVGYQYVDTSV